MGKREKEHRAKVAKRNRKLAQDRYSMQNAMNRIMEQIRQQKDNEKTAESLEVKVGESQVPFTVIDESELNSIVEFKEENQEIFDVEKDNGSI